MSLQVRSGGDCQYRGVQQLARAQRERDHVLALAYQGFGEHNQSDGGRVITIDGDHGQRAGRRVRHGIARENVAQVRGYPFDVAAPCSAGWPATGCVTTVMPGPR